MKRQKGAEAKRKASYEYQVTKLTKITQEKYMGPQPYGHVKDHIIPVSYGKKYPKDFPPELIADRRNLQWLPYQENIQKGQSITEDSIRVMRLFGKNDHADRWEYKLNQLRKAA